MQSDKELIQQAIDALQTWRTMHPHTTANAVRTPTIEALRARLDQCDAGQICLECRVCPDEQPAPEPIGFFSVNDYGNWEQNESGYGEPFYAAQPQRKWQGLTDKEIYEMVVSACSDGSVPSFDEYMHEDAAVVRDVARAIEAKLKEKNV